jgi:hypothetical protein
MIQKCVKFYVWCAHNWIISSTKWPEKKERSTWRTAELFAVIALWGSFECFLLSNIYSFSMGHKKSKQAAAAHSQIILSSSLHFSVLKAHNFFFLFLCWLGNETSCRDQEKKKILFYFWNEAKIYRAAAHTTHVRVHHLHENSSCRLYCFFLLLFFFFTLRESRKLLFSFVENDRVRERKKTR